MTQITIEAKVYAPREKVREMRTQPEHIMQRNHASDDWHCPAATSDVRVGGTFSSTMAAKDGSMSFDFAGQYTVVEPQERLEYVLGEMEAFDLDAGRTVTVLFDELSCGSVMVTETFDAEPIHSLEQQEAGRQAILNNFKVYVENN